jgi:hypothetical protein
LFVIPFVEYVLLARDGTPQAPPCPCQLRHRPGDPPSIDPDDLRGPRGAWRADRTVSQDIPLKSQTTHLDFTAVKAGLTGFGVPGVHIVRAVSATGLQVKPGTLT